MQFSLFANMAASAVRIKNRFNVDGIGDDWLGRSRGEFDIRIKDNIPARVDGLPARSREQTKRTKRTT